MSDQDDKSKDVQVEKIGEFSQAGYRSMTLVSMEIASETDPVNILPSGLQPGADTSHEASPPPAEPAGDSANPRSE